MTLKNNLMLCLLIGAISLNSYANQSHRPTGAEERSVWVNTLVAIVDPVLTNLASGTLRATMPQESLDGKRGKQFSHLEAVGRTLRC